MTLEVRMVQAAVQLIALQVEEPFIVPWRGTPLFDSAVHGWLAVGEIHTRN
jgi:hypothetical protein